jgi:hypothetical protein
VLVCMYTIHIWELSIAGQSGSVRVKYRQLIGTPLDTKRSSAMVNLL